MNSKPSNQGYNNQKKQFSSQKNEYNSYNSNDDYGRLNQNDTEFGNEDYNNQNNAKNSNQQYNG